MLAVVVADVEVDGDFQFERQKVGTTPIDLRRLADWLVEQEVDEVVMESTAQYLAAGVGSPGTALAPPAPRARRRAARSRARSISPKRNRIVDPADARGTSPMRSGW